MQIHCDLVKSSRRDSHHSHFNNPCVPTSSPMIYLNSETVIFILSIKFVWTVYKLSSFFDRRHHTFSPQTNFKYGGPITFLIPQGKPFYNTSLPKKQRNSIINIPWRPSYSYVSFIFNYPHHYLSNFHQNRFSSDLYYICYQYLTIFVFLTSLFIPFSSSLS